jgi:protein pelota
MVEAVRTKGGEVCIFSSMHESGERMWMVGMCLSLAFSADVLSSQIELNQLSGIAAILTFPVDVEAALEEEKAEREAEAAAAASAAANETLKNNGGGTGL